MSANSVRQKSSVTSPIIGRARAADGKPTPPASARPLVMGGSGAAYASTTFRMCVATATTSPRWFVTVTLANDFRAASSRSAIS